MPYSLTVLVLSGPIVSGKTMLAKNLGKLISARHVSTSGLIIAAAGRELDRGDLQAHGQDTRFQGADWIVGAVRQIPESSPAGGDVVVVDAIRTLEQLAGLRGAAAGSWRILHVHLDGEGRLLASRHDAVRQDRDAPWDQAMASPTEAAARALEAEADVVMDTTRATPADIAARVAARLNNARSQASWHADVLVGG